MYAPPGIWRGSITLTYGICVSFSCPCPCLLCWGSCSSAAHLSACWSPQSASFVIGNWWAPSLPGGSSSAGSSVSSSVSPPGKMSVSHPETPSESQATTHCVTSSCVFSSSWSSREMHPSCHWGGGQFLLCPVLQKPLALFCVLAEFLPGCLGICHTCN